MKTIRFLLTATLGVALAFTLSCSSDDGSGDGQSSSNIASSSSDITSSSSSDEPSCSSNAPSSSSTAPSSSSSLPSSSSNQAIVPLYGEPITDSRDGQTYETVIIGNQTWMVKVLNFETETGSKCNEDNNLNCTIYGRLYNWEAAMTACPEGWHLPSDVEYVILKDFANGNTKDYGFASNTVGSRTWTSTESGTSSAYTHISNNKNNVSSDPTSNSKSNTYYVRCVKGNNYSPSLNNSSYTPVSCTNIPDGGFCDDRDGKGYKSVVIDGKTWMAENLNYNAANSKCYGEDGQIQDLSTGNIFSDDYFTISDSEVKSNCATYGKLYYWSTAMAFEQACDKADCSSWITEKHKGICPTGWHIPSKEEFQALINCSECGGPSTAGYALKATHGWAIDDLNGADLVGFSALPGGHGNYYSNGYYYLYGTINAEWWSSNASSRTSASTMSLNPLAINQATLSEPLLDNIYDLHSLRCVKD